MNHIQKRTIGALLAAAAVITLISGCAPTKQEELDPARMRIDCDRLGGELTEHANDKISFYPACTFDDTTNLRNEEER